MRSFLDLIAGADELIVVDAVRNGGEPGTLYRLEDKGLIEGRWVEKAGQRRRRCYRLTASGRRALAAERSSWQLFFNALDRVAGIGEAG